MRASFIGAVVRKAAAFVLVLVFVAQPLGLVFAGDEAAVQGSDTVTAGSGASATVAAAALEQSSEEEPLKSAVAESGTTDGEAAKEGEGSEEEAKPIEEPPSPELLMSEEDDPALFLNAKLDKETHTLRPDEMSGALRYTFGISIPPGRQGMEPQLNLEYSSQDRSINSLFGQGWKIDIPYIQRVNKTGLESLYASTTNFFYSSVSGELATTSTAGRFFPRSDDGSFIRYEFANNQWTATDKAGTTYKYGHASSTRQDHPTDGSKAYKWMLEEVRDTNGNTIRYEYFKDSGQIYPASIFYTGTSSSNGIFEVAFPRTARSDVSTTTDAGFGVTTRYVINQVDAKVSGQTVRSYALGYGFGDNGTKALLTSIVESGVTEQGATTTLPTVEFEYSTSTRSFVQDANYNLPPYPFVRTGHEYGERSFDLNRLPAISRG